MASLCVVIMLVPVYYIDRGEYLQHEEVSHHELGCVEKGANALLPHLGSVAGHGRRSNRGGGARSGGIGRFDLRRLGLGHGDRAMGILADKETVVLLNRTAKTLEGDCKKDDADTRTGKHTLRLDVPRGRQEAGVDSIPVPEHLLVDVSIAQIWLRQSLIIDEN